MSTKPPEIVPDAEPAKLVPIVITWAAIPPSLRGVAG